MRPEQTDQLRSPRLRAPKPMIQRASRRLRNQPCAFCNRHPAGSVDHIPPKCFFPDPLPTDLITVPSCIKHNVNFSTDDLYVRDVIVCRRDVVTQLSLSAVKAKLLRSLDAPENGKLRAMIGQTLRRGDVRLRSGLYLPDQFVFFVDKSRLLRWIERILRGLYYHEHQTMVPADFTVTPILGEEWPDLVQEWVGWFRSQRLRKSGEGVFEYKWMRIPDEPEATIWCLELYRCVPFLGCIFPPSDGGMST